jgi:hypothetical protein
METTSSSETSETRRHITGDGILLNLRWIVSKMSMSPDLKGVDVSSPRPRDRPGPSWTLYRRETIGPITQHSHTTYCAVSPAYSNLQTNYVYICKALLRAGGGGHVLDAQFCSSRHTNYQLASEASSRYQHQISDTSTRANCS